MDFIKVEVRPTLATSTLACAVIPLWFISILGLVTTICFASASAFLFISFAIIPKLAKDKCKNLIFRHRREPLGYYENDLSEIIENAHQNISDLYKVAGTFYIVGLVAFAMNH